MTITRSFAAAALAVSFFAFDAHADAPSVTFTAPPPVPGEHGMVVSVHRIASQVGIDILKKGGNAVDAAVAVGYALAVVYPEAGNIGGGGFMTLRLADGHETFLDFRERAPLAATENMYLDAKGNVVPNLSTDGWLSVGVPGTVMGLETARKQWGTMTRSTLLAPAIALAKSGFVLTSDDTRIVGSAAVDLLRDHPDVFAHFTKPGGVPYAAGDRLVQPQLAATLKRIADFGPHAFYAGAIADQIVAASAAGHGIITKADLQRYHVRELAPVTCDYRGYHIVSSPPPSSGGVVLCEMLHIVEGFPMDKLDFHSVEEVHDLTEAMRLAFADRNNVLGDPAFVKNPVARLIDPAYAAKLRAKIDPQKAGKSVVPAVEPHEGNNTTHYSIVDKAGNAVSVTYTLNNYYGARVMAGNTGIVMNDEMDDFTSKPGVPNLFGLIQGKINAIAPGKTPLSSMTPTIVTRNGHVVMVLGSPGGPRIITSVFESIVNVVDHDMNISQAVAAPRLHHQWLPDTLFAEPGALASDVAATLAKNGYTIDTKGPWRPVEAIQVAPPRGAAPARLLGAADQREPSSTAIGY
ncbi:MAG TPA: gamma-glutamyltransferase [Magnetospirillaceae bacterium]|jgi:gamma-glutamyltranspeptidase/glutathione hydrolase